MKRCIFTIIVLLLVVGCQPAETSPTPTATTQPTATASSTPEPTAIVTPTVTPIPTPTLPPLDTSDEGYQVVITDGPEGSLYRLGIGWRKSVAMSPDSSLVALPATTGLHVYRTDNLEPVWAATDKPFVRMTTWSPDGSRVIALHDDSVVSIFAAGDGSLLNQFPVDLEPHFILFRYHADISPNNQLVFAGKHLYDAESGEELTCAYCPQADDSDYDARLSFTANSVLRAARPCDEAVFCLWDSDSGEAVPYPLPGVQEGGPIAISPDTNWVLVQTDNTVRLFDVETETYHLLPELTDAPFRSYFLHEAKSITWSPDSSAFTLQSDKRTYLFQTGAETSTLNWDERGSVLWSPDSRLILYSDQEGSVRIYEVSSGEQVLEAAGRSPKQLLDNGVILWITSFDGNYRGLIASTGDLADYDYALVADIFSYNLVSAGWTPDNLLMAIASDSEFLFFDGASGELAAALDTGVEAGIPAHRDYQWSVDGNLLAWLIDEDYSDYKVVVWDRASGEPLATTFKVEYRVINSIALSSDGSRLLVGSERHSTITLFDVETGAILHQVNEDDYSGSGMVDLTWSPDGSQFASVDGGTIEPIIVWDAETFTPLYTLMPEWEDRTYINTINWVGDLIAASSYSKVFVWQPSTQSLLWSARLESEGDACEWSASGKTDNQLALSADARYLAAVTSGGTQGCGRIAIFDAHTGDLLHIYPGNGGNRITRLAWSPDGQYLASVAREDTIVVWDTSLLPPVEIP